MSPEMHLTVFPKQHVESLLPETARALKEISGEVEKISTKIVFEEIIYKLIDWAVQRVS